ncbi:MAG: hypothetical protein N3A65_01615 [candidate division WOR-3 bacterium]|nr:hypothetical protein [candidate division WOR-3 bacterium]
MNEDSARYGEAFYYYRKIVEFDSSRVDALNRMHLMDSLLLAKHKADKSPKSHKKV